MRSVVMYQADEKRESSLVSVVNKSRYRDTHSDTDYLFLLGAVSRKQHAINIICV